MSQTSTKIYTIYKDIYTLNKEKPIDQGSTQAKLIESLGLAQAHLAQAKLGTTQ